MTNKQLPRNSSILLFVTLANVSQSEVYSSNDFTSGGKDEILGKTRNMGKNTYLT